MPNDRKPNRKLKSDDEASKSKNKVDVRVWRFDRKEEKRPAEESDSKAPEKKVLQTTSNKPTGKKLWIRGTPDGAVKAESAPAGFEKHRDVTNYIVEEQEKQRELRQKAKEKRMAMQKKRPRPVFKEIRAEVVEEVVKFDPINVIYTVAMGKQSFQKLIERLVDAGVETILDLRSDNAMFGPGISKERDLAILLKEMAGIEYRRDEILLPARETKVRFEQDKNWHRFVSSYTDRLQYLKVETVLDRDQFVKNKVALLGERPEPEKDQRHIVAAYLEARWGIATVIEIK